MVKALRMTEEEYTAAQKRLDRTQHRTGWPFTPTVPSGKINKNADPATHKFHAKQSDGYASASEAKRAAELKLLERQQLISDLREQVPFVLIEAQHYVKQDGTPGIEHACRYIADFVYVENGVLCVEDCKGMRTGAAYAVYVIKRKLMLLLKGIHVREVYRGA